MFYSIIAGGNYGHRKATYKLVKNILLLKDEGNCDNLVGNDICAEFEGLTVKQAERRIEIENSIGSGCSYDGCHSCTWSISIRYLDNSEVPAYLTS